MGKLQNMFKRAVIVLICTLSVATAICSTIPIALAKGSSDILGTNTALGSPILNNNFTVNDWNKWEMLCWGVFLSNFCVPLIDDYETCFMVGKGGSNGSGYKALCFGSGNDPVNNETIESLTTYAAVQQRVSPKDIYVSYSKVKDGKYTEEAKDPNDASNASTLRVATFEDFFFSSEIKDDTTCANLTDNGGLLNLQTKIKIVDAGNYTPIAVIQEANVPTFWLYTSSGKYVKIFDFRDSWDAQMMPLIVNATRNSEEYGKAWTKAFEELDGTQTKVQMDSFGNLVVNSKILVPASVNKHITRDEDINLMNSWVMNGYNGTYSNKQLVLGLRQDIIAPPIENIMPSTDLSFNRTGGTPAFGESKFGNICLMYYDMDTIVLSGEVDTYGDALLELFNADIKSTKTKLNLKIEITDKNHDITHDGTIFKANVNIYNNTKLIVSALTDMNTDGTSGRRVLDYIVDMYGNKLPLYSDNGVIIANQLLTAKSNEVNSQGAVRSYYNFLYEIYSGIKSSASLDRATIEIGLRGSGWDTFKEFAVASKSNYGNWFNSFLANDPFYSDLKPGDLANMNWVNVDINENDIFTSKANRLVKAYPVSDQMHAVSQIFACKDNTTFRQYSTMIYMTYLDFYNITSNTSLTGAKTKTSNFNETIFDESSDVLNTDISNIIDVKSEEELESEVLNYSYLMLHPEKGRIYRQQLIENTLADWLTEHYNRIVYGGYNKTYSGSVSKSNSGFLSIETNDENIFISWFLKIYPTAAVWLITMGVLISAVLGIVKSKKFSWYIINILIIVNTVLIVPSSGDIVPYITSNMIQKMFSSKMTYWSISQGVTNAQLESDAKTSSGYTEGMSADDAAVVVSVVKQLSSIYTDRSLMVKQDISQKITQAVEGSYADIQSIQSARWILPMVMQQFTGDNKSEDYIYKPLANIWDDMSNMYWYFDPDDATATETVSPTATSGQGGESVPSQSTSDMYANLASYYLDYKVVNEISDNPYDINYRSYAYTINGDPSNQVHLVFGYLPDKYRTAVSRHSSMGSKGENYKNVDSWQQYIDYANHSGQTSINWSTGRTNEGFEETADSYNRNLRNTITNDMPYLLMTENPTYYFYCTVKDTFDITSTLGSVIGQLQGQIKTDDSGNEVRANFMYATVGNEIAGENADGYTEYIRDILDLEELFTNLVPYLYQMQLSAGGFDGKSGILGDATISKNLRYYEGELQSWMYRCNWATKLMENPDYSEPYTVSKKDGSKVTIPNPVLPETYPDDRPMVFSEAQKMAMGLTDADLNIVELKCIEVNKRVARQWTLLINYAGTGGLTKEVLMRQMATDATLIFCDEFSSTGILNTMYTMYPQSLDLRYLSFDSVMKMLVMNVSKNTSYIYGDTMSTLIEDTDLFTSALLMLDAYICAYWIPFIRSLFMAFVFLAGLLAVISSILSSSKYKAKVTGGVFLQNIAFTVYTILYYWVFSALMAVTSSDEVLQVDKISVSSGNPVAVLLIVMIAGLLYMAVMGLQMWFCKNHWRDMGFEALSIAASGIVDNISGALHSAGGTIRNFFNSESNTSVSNTSNTNSIKGTGKMGSEAQDVNIKKTAGDVLKVEKEDEMKDNAFMDADYMGNYNVMPAENMDYAQAAEIDAEIKAGEEMKID